MTTHLRSQPGQSVVSATPLLDVSGLRVSAANGTAILHGVDLTLAPAEVVALVGESGSGKSTLVNAISRLLPPGLGIDAGTITFDGRDLLALDARAVTSLRGAQIGYVPQDPGTSLNPVRTIGAQLAEVFALHRPDLSRDAARQRSIELLARVGINRPEQRFNQYPHELSGGMKQRVLIAIGFALNPRLLIADEPTSALDVTVQQQVMAVFDGLVREFQTTVIFVTHDIGLAADHASRLIVMREGRIVDEGSLHKVATAPAHAYTRHLIRSAVPSGTAARAASAIIDGTPAIKVGGLGKRFLSRRDSPEAPPAVSDVSFEVPRGSTFALVGESGSGKSTTARIVLGLETPTAGWVRVAGLDVHGPKPAQRKQLWREVQMVYQNPFSSLNPRQTVSSIVAAPLLAHGIGTRQERSARAAELLDAVSLPKGAADRYPTDLSGGQRQRVAIARALALDARILVLDEPFSALDVVTREQILDLLTRLKHERGLTFLFISHDLATVRSFADHVGVMRAGRLVEQGSVADVFDTPSDPYTRALLAAHPGHSLARILGADGAIPTPSMAGELQ